jgi:uncharacterized protein YciI
MLRSLVPLAAAAAFACSRAPAPATPTPAAPAPAVGTAPAPRSTLDLTAIDFKPPPGMRFYYVAFLRRGPAWSAEDSEANRKLGEGHMANIERLAAEGTLVLAGPFVDSEGAGDLAGIFVLAVDSLAAARAAIDSDPAVKAGRFTVELRAWLAGDQIRTAQPPPAPPAASKPD